MATRSDYIARGFVKQLLLQTHNEINFSLSSVDFNPDRLRAVGEAIDARRIFVEYNSAAATWALYRSIEDKLVVGITSSVIGRSNVPYAALIIHEGIHASMDICNAGWMGIQTSEAAGYIAQYIYLFTHGLTVLPPAPL